MCARQGFACRRRIFGTLRRRLGARTSRSVATNQTAADRQKSGHRRFRASRPHRRRRTRQARPRRDNLRGAAQARRRASLRHPGISSAQKNCRAGSRAASRSRRENRVQRRHRPHLHDSGIAGKIRRHLHRQRRGFAGVHERAGRKFQGCLFRERIPHTHQFDGGV